MSQKKKPAAKAQNMQNITLYLNQPTNSQISANYKRKWLKDNQPKLEAIKCLLKNGKYIEAHDELQDIRFEYDPARVALYKMHAYGLDGKKPNSSWLLHLVRNSAVDGHIPSMYLLTKLLKNGTYEDNVGDAELWRRRTCILDPGCVWDRELLDLITTPSHLLADDVLNVLDEGTVPFYQEHEAAQKPIAFQIAPCPERFFSEPVGGSMYKELIARTVVLLEDGKIKQAKRLLEQASGYDHLAAKLFVAQYYYGQGRKEDFFDCVKYGASYDIVPCMFTTSACYRYGYGVERSDDLADAWYWMACQYDIDNRGLKEAILLNV